MLPCNVRFKSLVKQICRTLLSALQPGSDLLTAIHITFNDRVPSFDIQNGEKNE